jgi:hypothetical protein
MGKIFGFGGTVRRFGLLRVLVNAGYTVWQLELLALPCEASGFY